VGVREARGRSMERRGEEYICPTCTSKRRRLLQPGVPSKDFRPASLPDVVAPTASAEKVVEVTQPQESKVRVYSMVVY